MLLNGTITGLIMGGILSLPVLGVAVIYGITGIPNFAIGISVCSVDSSPGIFFPSV